MKQLFSYYGGKQNLIKHILPLIPPHECYLEPFCGGATVLFHKQPAVKEIINDLNGNVINFYRVCKSKDLLPRLDYLVQCSLRSTTIYEDTRQIYLNPAKHSKVIRAHAFWYQACFSFQNNINKTLSITDSGKNPINRFKKDFINRCKRLTDVQLEHIDAIALMRKHSKRNPFSFIDPPYMADACQGHYSGYTQDNWIELLTYLQNEYKGKFMLTSYGDEFLTDFTERNKWNTVAIQQATSGNVTTKGKKTEVITMNYKHAITTLF